MYLQTKRLLNVFFMLIAFRLSAQNNKPELYQPLSPSERLAYRDDLPSFVKMTFQAQPNFKQVEAAFAAFEKEEKKEKAEKARKRPKTENVPKRNLNEEEEEDIYEVYYERWKRAYKPFVQSDGSIVLPTVAQYKQNILTQNRLNQRRLAPSSSASWTNIGPKETFWLKNDRAAQSACPWQVNIYAFDISKSDPSVLYACPETGGVFKTVDKGLNWTACGSNLFNFGGTAGAVEIHPTDPNIVYVSINAFLWKSTDGGDTWTDLTNCTATGVNDIAISPTDPNLVMIAADNGFFRSTDAGSTWTRIYTTACYDIELNPTDVTHVFILKSDGTNNQFFKSTDSGASFTLKNMGYSTLLKGRLTVTAADGNRIYALCLSSTNPPKLLKSADEGETWSDINATFCTGGVSDATGGQGYYDLSIAASQTNANELIFGMCSTTKAVSTDGGTTFTYTNLGGYCGDFALHPDLQEAKAIMNNGVMETWVSTDGGLTLSTDFFTSTTNALARNNGIYSTNFWGYSQGWNEDIMVGGRYHNGNTALADFYPSGKALRMGGAEAGTGYVLHGTSRAVVFSDSKDMILPPTFYDYGQTITYNKFPNEDGYGFDASNLVIHPLYYKQQYLGEGNSLWLTKDNGITFEMVRDFGSKVRRFEISRSNPLVFYLATDASFNKSSDGGTTWSSVSLPSGRSSGSLYLAINPNNDQDIWIAFKNISGTGKVYQSTNGGSSWTNQDGTILGSLKIKNIIHTGGAIYIAADDDNGRVFYRSNSATNWTDFSTNLPISMDILKMLPFYRDGKLRVAGNRGIWETALESDVAPLALPAVDKSSTTCTRDTFYFDDYSILKHAGATWAWSFSPTPQYVSSTSARNPKVVFGAIGNYSVTLTVTNSTGTSTKTIANMITVTSDGNCELSSVIGKAMSLTVNGDKMDTPLLNLNKDDGRLNNEITLMAWVKPNGIQSAYTSIIGTTSGSVELLIQDNNKLGLSWNGNQWGWSSGLTLASNEWAHVALVANGTNLKLYLNGKEAINTTTPVALDLATTWIIGMDRDWTSRTFKGLIDEVCLYNRALTINELREKMHLIKNPASEVGLKGYYQFDETSGVVWNKALNSSTNFTGAATRATSTAPVATGTSQRISVTTGGIKDFTTSNVSFEWPLSAILPNGDMVVSKLNAAPDQLPTGGTPLSTKYWIVNNYGTNPNFTPLLNLKFKNLSSLSSPATNYKLYRRNFNAEGATWGTTLDGGDDLASNTLTFTPAAPCVGISAFGQFAITDDVSATPPVPSGDACLVGTVTGKSLSLATNQSFSSTVNLTNVTQFTATAWIKPNGAQAGFAGIVSNGEGSAHGGTNTNGLVFDYHGTKLWYRWAGVSDTWGENSGMVVPLNEWSYVGMVVTNDSIALYLNDQKYVHVFTGTEHRPTAASINDLYIGYGHYYKYFKGEIEEVRVWNKALTQDQIREMRHLTNDNAFESDANFLAYYQFNEQLGGKVINKARNVHGALNNSATLVPSTAPVGSGVSQKMLVTSGGLKTFATPNVDVTFPTTGIFPNGEIVVTRLDVAPDQNPTGGTAVNKTWIINNYGLNATFTPLNSLKINDLSGFGTGAASNFKLYKRSSNADGTTWATPIDGSDNLISSGLVFNPISPCLGITSFGQLTITDDVTASLPTPCIAQAIPTQSATFTGSSTSNFKSVVPAPNFGTSQNFTIAFWVKSANTASDATIISDKNWGTGRNKGWVFAYSTNKIRFNIGDATNRIDLYSQTGLNDNQWHHIAASVTRTGNAVLYVDGVNKQSTSATALTDIYTGYALAMGTDALNNYPLLGQLDEVKIWDVALSQDQIREKMHLTTTSSEANLLNYYQFNNLSAAESDLGNQGNNLTAGAAVTRSTSTAPVAGGTSQRMTITTGGVKDFANQHLSLEFPSSGTYPNGEMVVSELAASPDQMPSVGTALTGKYWIVNNYGTNATFSTLTNLKFSNLGNFASGSASNYKLYKRTSNSDAAWGTNLDVADDLTTTNNNTLTFSTGNNLTSFSQFTVTKESVLLSLKVFLEGAFNTVTGKMNDGLRSNNLIPLTEPFTGLSFTHVGGGNEQVSSTVLAVTGDNAIVDWVLVELRDATTPTTVLATRSALLQVDGDLVDVDGVSPLAFQVQSGDYQVVIKHRNHLRVKNAATVTLTVGNSYAFDFTNSSLTNKSSMKAVTVSGTTVYVMYAGDVNQDGSIDATDRSTTWNQRNVLGYNSNDCSLNGTVDATDRSATWNNRNGSSGF